MPTTRQNEFMRPGEYPAEFYSQHHQCDECGRITKGPGYEKWPQPPRYSRRLHHIDEQGTGYTYEEAEKLGEPYATYNVSTGKCPNCGAKFMNKMARSINWRGTMREWAETKRKFDETTERTKQRYEETLARNKTSFEETMGIDRADDDSAPVEQAEEQTANE